MLQNQGKSGIKELTRRKKKQVSLIEDNETGSKTKSKSQDISCAFQEVRFILVTK